MGIAEQVIRNANELSSCVIIERSDIFGDTYSINQNYLDGKQTKLMQDCRQFISDKLSSEMRGSNTSIASTSCKEVTDFATKLLQSQSISPQLMTAMFKELNILGYMFDRSRENYRICAKSLNDFLDVVEKFKKTLDDLELTKWNKSTYGGEDQVPFFRGFLKGIMMR